MKKSLFHYSKTCLLLTGAMALAGCQTVPDVEQPQMQAVTMYSQLQYQDLNLPDNRKLTISETTQMLDMGDIDSPVAAFTIPANRGGVKIMVASEIEKSVFAPSVMILDNNGKLLKTVAFDDFEYRRPKLLAGNRLVAEFEFYPPTDQETVRMVVYSATEDQSGTTDVVHPARISAEAQGDDMSELADIPIPHGLVGRLEIDIDGVSQKVEIVPASSIENATTMERKQQQYIISVDNAVKEGNIEEALLLRDQAKSENIPGADEIFKEAISNQ